MKIHQVLLTALSVGSLCGCASNPFKQFYSDKTANVAPAVLSKRLMPYSGATQVFTTPDHQRDGQVLMQRGYLVIGESAFEGAVSVTEAQIKDQAKIVGADIVLWSSSYQGASQAAVPFVQYQPGANSTTYSSGTVNANAYGTGGSAHGTATYSGYSTTTSPGTFSTTIVPITVHRYAHGATFWRKARPPVFGVFPESLPEDMRHRLQRNTGAIIKLVGDDTPAFRANILAGDIVIRIGDEEIMSAQHLLDVLPKYAGQTVAVTLLRDGVEKSITVRMNAAQ